MQQKDKVSYNHETSINLFHFLQAKPGNKPYQRKIMMRKYGLDEGK